MRNIILHNHFFKNGGSTIDWALEKNFYTDFCDHRDDLAMRSSKSYLLDFLRENTSLKAISTHHLKFPIAESKGFHFLILQMIRHPIERVLSVYNFEKSQLQSESLGAKFAREHSFRDYIIWRMEESTPATIRNFHTLKLCNRNTNSPTVNDLDDCKSFIQDNPYVGILENFDESLLIFELQLKKYFPEINLAYIKQNIGISKSLNFDEKIQYIEEQLGSELYETVRSKNKLDLELYDFAKKGLQKRLNSIPEFCFKLKLFKSRCKKLSKTA